MCRRYLSFVTQTTDKTLEDYFALFRRLAMVDLLLVVAYGVQVGINISLLVGDLDTEAPLGRFCWRSGSAWSSSGSATRRW